MYRRLKIKSRPAVMKAESIKIMCRFYNYKRIIIIRATADSLKTRKT